MRIPMTPPNWSETFSALVHSPEGADRFKHITSLQVGPAPEGKYRHWDILRHLTPPGDLTHEEWWLGIKLARQHLYQNLEVVDKEGQPFKCAMFDVMLQMLREVDNSATGSIKGSEMDRSRFSSLVEESITSSQLEGAATTREVAKEMIRSGRSPRDKSEQMIFNNYQAM